MSRRKKFSLTCLSVFLVLLGSFAFLLGTASGVQWVLRGVSAWVPGLAIAQVEGRWQSLSLKGIGYKAPGIRIDIDELHWSLNWRAQTKLTIAVDDFAASNVRVALETNKMTQPESAAKRTGGTLTLKTPFPVVLKKGTLQNVYVAVDATTLSLQALTTALHWTGKSVSLGETRLENVLLSRTEGVHEKKDSSSKAMQSSGEMLQALFAKPLVSDLPDIRLPVNLSVEGLSCVQCRLLGEDGIAIERLKLKASAALSRITIETLHVESSLGDLSLTGRVELAQSWPLDLTLKGTFTNALVKDERALLQIKGALKERLSTKLDLSGPLSATLEGEAELSQAGLPLTLNVQSPSLDWPLADGKIYRLEALKLHLNGKATDYTLEGKAALKGTAIPEARFNLQAKGSEQALRINRLEVQALEGSALLTGGVDWREMLRWHADMALQGVNTAKSYPEWPATLAGTLQTRGHFDNNRWALEFSRLKFDGRIKDNALTLEGEVRGESDGQWHIPALHLALGVNRADISGEVTTKRVMLNASIDAPHLDDTLPALSGKAKGVIKLRGDWESPQLSADFNADQLRWQEWSVGTVHLKGDVHSSARIQGNVTLAITNLQYPGVDVKDVTLDLKGDEKEHQLSLQFQGKPISGQLVLRGDFDRAAQRWQGVLSHTRLETPLGLWTQDRAVRLDYRYAVQRFNINAHCWNNPDAQVCFAPIVDAGETGHLAVALKRLDLTMFKRFLSRETKVVGTLSGDAAMHWNIEEGALPQGTFNLSGHDVALSQQVNGASLPVAVKSLDLHVNLTGERAQLESKVRLSNEEALDAQIEVENLLGDRKLLGNVLIRHFSLGLINPILSAGERVEGVLDAQLRLAGNVSAPQLFGTMSVSGLDVDGNFMPFEMKPSHITLRFEGESSLLAGLIETQEGSIELSGGADWQQLDNWQARIAAKGEKVRVSVAPMLQMDVAPDVALEARPDLITLTGRVDVPWARIVVQQLPESAVAVSSDVVMLNKDLQPETPKARAIPISADVTVHVGDDVQINAFGLNAGLTGDLKVFQDKQGLGLNGQINIAQGRFRAYGQDLLIQRGTLLFSGPPDQPLLSIEAIRNPDATEDGVTAGVRVTGSVKEPKIELFSDPAMSQQETLSYLLRGQGLDSPEGDGSVMTSMLIGLGIAQSGQLVGKIGEMFGISDLALDTQGVGDASQIVVSGYVLPGLQIKYGVGIFDSLTTLTIRYRLMPKLYLEAVSGLNQAIDLLYRFEFN